MTKMKFCQSCGMPLDAAELGTNQDGSKNEDYCEYCYQNGAFTKECSMEEMIELCAPFMTEANPGMTQEQAVAQMRRFLPGLKRWQTEVHGHCVCGAVEVTLKQYGNFVYTCHCDTCRRMNSGPVLSVDPGPKENVVFERGEDKITIFHDQEVERGFCSVCGSTLFWHDPAKNHYCMNAELFDRVIQNAAFELELFYDQKPAYYSFAGERQRLNHKFEEM